MYMLNMLFNFNNTDGLFSSFLDLTTPADPLKNSKRWLRYRGPAIPDKDNPTNPGPNNSSNWDDIGRFNVLIPSSPHKIALRFAPAPDTPMANLPSAGATLECAVCYGRPPVGGGNSASPFRDGPIVKTTFIVPPFARTAGEDAWFVPLDVIHPSAFASDRDVTNRFEFAIGIIVRDATTTPQTTRHYGEDPEDDVGG